LYPIRPIKIPYGLDPLVFLHFGVCLRLEVRKLEQSFLINKAKSPLRKSPLREASADFLALTSQHKRGAFEKLPFIFSRFF